MSLHDSRQRIACHFGESRVLNRDVHAGLGWHHLGDDWYDAQGGWLVGDDLKIDQAERFGHIWRKWILTLHLPRPKTSHFSYIFLQFLSHANDIAEFGVFEASLLRPWLAQNLFFKLAGGGPKLEKEHRGEYAVEGLYKGKKYLTRNWQSPKLGKVLLCSVFSRFFWLNFW